MDHHHPHILLVTYPAQGHINPSLQFAKRLIRFGVEVTFTTTTSAHRRMNKTSTPDGLNFVPFSDGYDDGFNPKYDDSERYMSEFRRLGTQALKDTISASHEQGSPISCLVYTILLPWAAEVAHSLQMPSALLWIQPATVLNIYYHYFNGYGEVIRNKPDDDPSWSVELPRLPSLKARDLPSFILPPRAKPYDMILSLIGEQVEKLNEEANPKVLVNTFDALEHEALKGIDKLNPIAIGPLIPSAFLDGKDPSDTSFGGDLFQKSNNYIKWLNTQPEASVVYVSFGSMLVLEKNQMEEIAKGLLKSRRPFLWVVRDKEDSDKEKEDEKLSCMEELEQLGTIVPWCSQLEVLQHPSLGCFVTHCGWNSTLESIASGVPVVAFPHWTDQGTNAKLIEDLWGTGVRVTANEGGLVEGEEIKRCIEMVMGEDERGREMRRNASKFKDLGREAVKEGGSSYMNLEGFVKQLGEVPLC